MSKELQDKILARLSTAGQDAIPSDVLQRDITADPKEMTAALRALMENRRVTLRRGGSGDNRTYLSLAHDLSDNFSLVLDAIRASGTSGVDQTQLAAKLRLSKSEILKAIHALLAQKHIQERRSFTNRAKRIYLLFHLEPSTQVTGGTLYSGEELDVAFVDELRRRIVAVVSHKRSVSLEEMTRFLDEECAMNNAAAASSNTGNNTNNNANNTSNSGPSSPFASPSSPIAFIHGSGGGFPNAPPQSSTALTSKRVLPRDVRVLMQTLTLDGVLDEVMDGNSGTTQYQLATGYNVMRHFTGQRKRDRQGRGVHDTLHMGINSNNSNSGNSNGGTRRQQMLAMMHEEGIWEPAYVSEATAGLKEAGGWSYMAAQGFPCLGCPLLASCTASDKGLIKPMQCAYLHEWLD